MSVVTAALLVALAQSIGWGIRGNFGHEYGAMIPGALSALAVCLALPSARMRERAALVGLAGAVGWSFGGSMSYGLMIGRTQSAVPAEAIYGFAMLGVIGFVWALIGGGLVGLAIRWPKAQIAAGLPPLLCVFAAWAVLDLATAALPEQTVERLSWWDTDWLGAVAALLAIAAWRLISRRRDAATSLMLWIASGWWAGFLLLVVVLDLHMTPPRSDNWAGTLGMAVALIGWLWRHREGHVLRAALFVGGAGAIGFMTGQWVANTGRAIVPTLNWWSVMEQTFGAIAGLGLFYAMRRLASAPDRTYQTPPRPLPVWADGFAVGFLLLVLPWVNLRKNPETIWLRNHVVPERMGPFAIETWLLLAFVAIASVVVLAIVAHQRRGLALVPETSLGRTQLLFLAVLWVMVIGNLSRYLPFPEGRLITEGVIHINAAIASALAILAPRGASLPAGQS